MSLEMKIAVCGAGATGKTALTIQYCQSRFLDQYDATVEDCYKKQVKVDNDLYDLEILDTAGQEEYKALRDAFIRKSSGFLLVFDLTHIKSLFELDEYMDHIIRTKDKDKNIPIVLVGNKCDLEREVLNAEVAKFLEKYQWKIPYIETSAKDGTNIQEAFLLVCSEIKKFTSSKNPMKSEVKPTRDSTSSGKKCSIL